MRPHPLLMLTVLAVSSQASAAEAVRAVVETPDAIYFEPTQPAAGDTVWVFPRVKTVFEPAGPLSPDFWLASIVLERPEFPTPDSLHPSWGGKTLRYYTLETGPGCELKVRPEMRFVQELIGSANRNIWGGDEHPVCQFSFKVRNNDASVIQALEAEAEQGILVKPNLTLTLSSTVEVPWGELHASLLASGAGNGPLTEERAIFLLGIASGRTAVAQAPAAVQSAFIQSALDLVFVRSAGDARTLVSTPPAGAFTSSGNETSYVL